MTKIDYGRGGREGAKVVYGKVVGFEGNTITVQGEDGTKHTAKWDYVSLWTGMWSYGIRPSDIPYDLHRVADDAAAQAFCRLSDDEKNKIVKRKFSNAYIRIKLGDVPEKDELFSINTRRYQDINAEDCIMAVRKRLPTHKVQVTTPSSGTHGGVITITEDYYAHFTPFVKIDFGQKDGRTPIRVVPGGFFPTELHFGVFTPKLKKLRHGYDTISIDPIRITHQGKPLKKILSAARELSIEIERMDWLCNHNSEIQVSKEEGERVLQFYIDNTAFSKRTKSRLPTWNGGTLHELAMMFLEGTKLRNLPITVETQLRNIAGELTVLGELWHELLEEI